MGSGEMNSAEGCSAWMQYADTRDRAVLSQVRPHFTLCLCLGEPGRGWHTH